MSGILLIIGIILIGLEALTVSTFLIWIAIGFIVASFAALFTTNIWVVLVIGIISTTISVVLFKDKYRKFILPQNETKTSYNEFIGKFAIMEANYKADGVAVGRANISGQNWSVYNAGPEMEFKSGEKVIVKKIEGVRLIIEKGE